jgi:hypothetical protein
MLSSVVLNLSAVCSAVTLPLAVVGGHRSNAGTAVAAAMLSSVNGREKAVKSRCVPW